MNSILIVIILSGLSFLLLIFFLRFSILPIFLFLVTFSLNTLLSTGLPSLQLGAFSISPLDGLAALTAISSLAALFLRKIKINRINQFFFVFGALLVFSLLRGMTLFGVELAVRYFRPYLYFYVAALSVIPLQLKPNFLKYLLSWWGWVAWFFVGLVFVRWFMVGFGIYQSPNWVAPGGMMTRVILAPPTFFLLQAVIFSWTIIIPPQALPLQKFIPYIMVPAIIILQHRTVWVVLVFILLSIFMLGRDRRPVFLILSMSIGLVVAGAMLVLWGSPLLDSLTGSAQNLRTFDWRVAGWLALLSPDRFQNIFDYVIGQPFGTGYTRYLFGSTNAIEVSPHNFYVQTFLCIGGAGLLILLMIYFDILKSLLKERRDYGRFSFALVLISQLLFFLTYSPSYEQGLLLGFATIVAGTKYRQ